MEEPMTPRPGETTADIDDSPETHCSQPEEPELEYATDAETLDEDRLTDREPDELVDEGADADEIEERESMEVEFSVDDTGEEDAEAEDSPPQEEEAEASVEQQDQGEAEEEEPPKVESVIEAVLFASDEPLTDSRLAGIVETTGKQVRECVAALNAKYAENHNAFRIEQIAGGYQMLTMSIYNNWLKKMLRARSDSKLSPAAMETLAIIAYKQPVIRADIEAIRGVAVGEVIRSLMYKGLVKIVGRAEILGRPMLYGTTKKFLEVFGLNSLKDLPKAEELKKPD
jgi:segregation and condensation protein B